MLISLINLAESVASIVSMPSLLAGIKFLGLSSINKYWHSAPLELKQAYQELVFPKGFVYDIKTRKFLTPEISPLYRLDLGEMGAKNDENCAMVSVQPALYKTIAREIIRWNEVLRGVYGFRGQAV